MLSLSVVPVYLIVDFVVADSLVVLIVSVLIPFVVVLVVVVLVMVVDIFLSFSFFVASTALVLFVFFCASKAQSVRGLENVQMRASMDSRRRVCSSFVQLISVHGGVLGSTTPLRCIMFGKWG